MSTCFYCGVELFEPAQRRNKHNYPLKTQDHAIPKSRCGPLQAGNVTLITCCESCNMEKDSLTIEEYRVLLAFRYGYISNVQFKFPGEL